MRSSWRLLKLEAGLTEEQARRAFEVFEDFMKRSDDEEGEPGGGLFSGATSLFEDKN